jgi:hypothetical protein
MRPKLLGKPWLESDNAWGIPSLDPTMQAAYPVPLTWQKWGEVARSGRQHRGEGVHFYTEDYKFSALVSRPDQVPNAAYSLAAEPNYSTGPHMPPAVALWSIYRKRQLARLWQAAGVRILVDLCIEPCFRDLALLGVPPGWTAYATRGLEGEMELLTDDYACAVRHAGTDRILFVVFGGHTRIAKVCADRGWTHIIERCTEVINGTR